MTLRGFSLALCAAVLLTSAVASAAPRDGATPRDGVFIHLTQGEEGGHRALMAFSMALIMAEDHDVAVYCDIKGLDPVLKSTKSITDDEFHSSRTQLAQLLDKGVTVMACPGCLKAAGLTPDDLAPGVIVADPNIFFSFTKGRIVSLSY